nr:MAG TPA: hypothetical protein [Caudoviricetes sp.]
MLKLNIIFTRSDLIRESAAGNLLNYLELVKAQSTTSKTIVMSRHY